MDAWTAAHEGSIIVTPRRGHIAFVFDGVELNGGNKQIFGHARLLAESGFEITFFGNGPAPDWTVLPGRYIDLTVQDAAGEPAFDLCVFTYFSSFRSAAKLRYAKLAHFCQGYEKFAPHLGAFGDEIDAFYRATPRTICISETVQRVCVDRYGKQCARIEPIVEDYFRPGWRLPWRRRRRILVPGIYEMPTKGVPLALSALEQVAAQSKIDLYRLSTYRRSAEERALTPHAIWIEGQRPLAVAKIMRGMDLVVTLPTDEEGFGLPALEAIASGIPVVCSPTLAYSPLVAQGAARTAAEQTAAGYAAAIVACLADAATWQAMRRACEDVAPFYRADAQRQSTLDAVLSLMRD